MACLSLFSFCFIATTHRQSRENTNQKAKKRRCMSYVQSSKARVVENGCTPQRDHQRFSVQSHLHNTERPLKNRMAIPAESVVRAIPVRSCPVCARSTGHSAPRVRITVELTRGKFLTSG